MIAIIDYRAGNLTSVRLAFDKLNILSEITRDPARIRAAERVVFPGDGAAGSAMANLDELELRDVITEVSADRPFLGICVGTQIILDYSQENGGVPCLGLLPGTVERFQTADPFTKIPQMGWNAVAPVCPHPLFAGIEPGSEFYFIHSYYPAPTSPDHVLARTDYADVAFASVVGRDNLAATQFHPERSGRIGLQLLKNFAEWDGVC
ncbi:MAG TPA: imidazole glycerol phosphate synthase subunit HisH [Lentisphaeria bacterium]|jgi:glutamine amidotransferase|nr:imidazole glycerol phosphate synthase subunit HisH [Lentisphaeria bacterium]